MQPVHLLQGGNGKTGIDLALSFFPSWHVMKDPRVPSDTVSGQATVCPFPLQQILERRQAAGYLGVPARRLWLLERIGGGPRPVRHQDGVLRYRRDELDRYSSRQFERAGLPPEFLARYRRQREQAGYGGLDPFLDLASRDEMLGLYARSCSRVAIVVGMVLIVLSHTPLSRMVFHALHWRFA